MRARVSTTEDRLARGGLYRLLARLWLREVDGPLLQQLGKGELGAAYVAAGGWLPPLATADIVEDLEIDFCQLFLGPTQHLPPYQSVWQDGKLEGQACQSMRDFADVIRYDLAEAAPGIMPDHLGLQLDLMGHVTASERVEDSGALDEWEDAFFAMHLGWPGPLLEAAEDRAETAFYVSLVSMTRGFLRSESGD